MLLRADASAIYQLHDAPSPISFQAGVGISPQQLTAFYSNEHPPGSVFVHTETLPQTGPLSETTVDADLPILKVDGHEYCAQLAVPLKLKDAIYGGLLLYYREPRRFSAEEIELAVMFGDQAALAIENARLRIQAEQTAVAAERNRIARDLHDSVTQTLFSASLIADVLPRLVERQPAEGMRRLEELRQLTRGALAEMRTLLLELRPATLMEVSIEELLRQRTEAARGRARIPIAVTVLGNAEMPPAVKVACYYVAQEALHNVARHARASQVQLLLHCASGQIRLTIHDDGQGFDPADVPPEHLGLAIMRERADSVGAQLTIDSRRGAGTTVSLVWNSPDGLVP